MRRTSISVDIKTVINRPLDSVWAFVSDLERLPEWLDEFVSVTAESSGPIGVGSVFRYTLSPGNRSSTIEVVEWVPGRRLAWDGPPLPWGRGAARPRGYFDIREVSAGTTSFHSSYQPELVGSMALMRRPLRRWLKHQRTADTRRLKELIEQT